LVVPFYDWSSEPVLMPYVYGVVDAARCHGSNVMLVTGGAGTSDVEEVVGSKMVDGVVLMEVRVDDERLKVVEQLAIPAVALGMPLEPVSIPFVDFDFEAAGRLCVDHLVGLGHRHIGLLASPPGTFEKNLGYAHRLWRGVASCVEEAGLVFHGLPVEPTMEGAYRALETLFGEQPAISGLIVHSEAMIDRLMQALHQRGKHVPADVSVIAIAWGELITHIVPLLTYVNVPAVEMGRTAFELLAEQGPGILLPAALVAGSTVGPPPTT
jgi:DNA-binding LacI/PurR family transcriptional regulator